MNLRAYASEVGFVAANHIYIYVFCTLATETLKSNSKCSLGKFKTKPSLLAPALISPNDICKLFFEYLI